MKPTLNVYALPQTRRSEGNGRRNGGGDRRAAGRPRSSTPWRPAPPGCSLPRNRRSPGAGRAAVPRRRKLWAASATAGRSTGSNWATRPPNHRPSGWAERRWSSPRPTAPGRWSTPGGRRNLASGVRQRRRRSCAAGRRQNDPHALRRHRRRRSGEDDVLLAGMMVDRLQRGGGVGYQQNAQAMTARETWLHSFPCPGPRHRSARSRPLARPPKSPGGQNLSRWGWTTTYRPPPGSAGSTSCPDSTQRPADQGGRDGG